MQIQSNAARAAEQLYLMFNMMQSVNQDKKIKIDRLNAFKYDLSDLV